MRSRAKDTLLLVGDGNSDRESLRQIFEGKYYILEAGTALQGVLLLRQNAGYIAAVVSDVPLADGSALRALAEACGRTAEKIPLIAIIQPAGTGENEEYAFILGAADVVLKPYTTLSIQRRVQVLVDLYLHQWDLERLAQRQSETIRRNHQIMVDTLSSIIEYRSTESGNHVLRIRRFTRLLLQAVAESCPEYGLDDTTMDIITSAAALHDIGKISIPDSILNKAGKLTEEEYHIIQSHTTVGSRLVDGLKEMGDTSYLRYIYNITLYHHERWDGSGYPQGLQGDEIPICAQVVGLTDAYDALTSQRVYKQAYSHDEAMNMILNGECGAFSPKLLECFKRVRSDFKKLAQQYADGYSPKSDDIRMPLPGPAPQSIALTSQQLFRSKYQAILHHLEDTVIEMDLDDRIYHVVYSPNPDFTALFADASFEKLPKRLLREAVHPEDAALVAERYGEGMLKLFRQRAQTFRLRCRMYSPSQGQYHPYEITLQRIHSQDDSQRMLLVIFHQLSQEHASAPKRQILPLLDTPVMYDLAGATLCCLNDEALTVREGAVTLSPMTLYRMDEIWEVFHNSLLALVVAEDRELVRAQLQGQDIRSGRIELEFRIQRKDSSPIWVLCRSRFYVGPDGTEYCYLTLTDVTRIQQRLRDTEAELRHTAVVMELPGTIPFRLHLKEDRIEVSRKWEERFGRELCREGLLRHLQSANYVHPDDLPLLRGKIQDMQAGRGMDVMDLRLAGRDGRYTWSRIRATQVLDLSGQPTHIIGAIYDIDQLKTDALSMQQQAQQDALTRLLNKASAQQAISAYLSHRQPDSLAAMLVMDLDNFKAINDSQGHFYGDAVLTQVGTTLRSLFRAQDVVGRSGGDEFMILLKDIPSQGLVRDRCKLLVETFHTQLQQLAPGLPVSVSVGAALAPIHGDSYSDLYRYADQALYSAKRRGKNQYAIFDPKDTFRSLLEPGANSTRIDSDFRITMHDDQIARFVFDRLYESQDLAETLQEMLAFIGEHMEVSRVYIFENNEDNTACSNTFEWCSPGIPPQKDALQNISYLTDIPGWPEVYDENGILYCTDVTSLSPLVRAVVEPQGIKSMLHCTIRDRGVFRGYVGFDECSANHLWTQGQVSLLKLLSGILSVFVTRLRTSQRNA